MNLIKLEEKHEIEKAKKISLELMAKYPDYYKVYTEAGNLSILSGEFKKAKDFFEKSIELCPYAIDSYYGLINVYRQLGLKKEAQDIRNRAKLYNLEISVK